MKARASALRSTSLLTLALLAGSAVPAPQETISQAELEALTAEIKLEIEALRQAEFPRPVAVSIADGEGFLAYVKARMDRSTTPEELAAQEDVAKLLGLIPADMDLLETMLSFVESQVGGFYDPETESFCLMDSFTGGLARVILAHELTHALDDQLHDLDGAMDARNGHTDRLTAYQGLVEGSGTALMNAWSMDHLEELQGADLSKIDMGLDAMGSTPPYLWRPLLAVYMRGAAFLTSAGGGRGPMPAVAELERAFASPPESTEQLLHPEKYWDEEALDPPSDVELKTRRVPEGWSLLHEDTLGELSLVSFVEPLSRRKGLSSQLEVMGARYTYPASSGWDGDRVALMGNGDARYLALHTVWDDEDEAEEFEMALEYLSEHLTGATEAMAAQEGVAGSGFQWKRRREEVTIEAWIGVEAGTRKDLSRALRFRVRD